MPKRVRKAKPKHRKAKATRKHRDRKKSKAVVLIG